MMTLDDLDLFYCKVIFGNIGFYIEKVITRSQVSVYRTIGPLVIIFDPKHRLWELVGEAVLTCPTINVLSKNKKSIKNCLLKIFILYNFKNLCILQTLRHVFIMSLLLCVGAKR